MILNNRIIYIYIYINVYYHTYIGLGKEFQKKNPNFFTIFNQNETTGSDSEISAYYLNNNNTGHGQISGSCDYNNNNDNSHENPKNWSLELLNRFQHIFWCGDLGFIVPEKLITPDVRDALSQGVSQSGNNSNNPSINPLYKPSK